MRRYILISVVVVLAAVVGPAHAQIKLPVYGESKANLKDVTYQDASEGDYKHGRLVRITRKDTAKEPINGILVRTDADKGLVYVRTEPGTPPKAFAIADIKRIDKGTIRTVGHSDDVVQPEVRELVIINGSKRTVSYRAPTLSPGELSQLNDLAAAENEMSRVESLSTLEEQTLRTALAVQTARRDAREAVNQLMWMHVNRYRNNVNLDPYVFQGWPNNYGYGQTIMFGGTPSALNPTLPSLAVEQVEAPVSVAKLPSYAESLAAAKRNYETARSHAVYQDGRLIAVIVSDAKH